VIKKSLKLSSLESLTTMSAHSLDSQSQTAARYTIDDDGKVDLFAIDMSQKDLKNITKQLMEQMSTVGFCQITNVPGHDEGKLLDAIKAFHAIPLDEKMKIALNHYNPKNKNKWNGYFPFLERDVANKEFFQLSRPFEDISEWERKGCPLYEEQPWVKDSEKLGLDWVL